MKTITLLTAISLMLAMTGSAVSGDAIDDLNMGLSKTSVFDTPTPAPYAYSDTRPGKNDWLPRAWEGAPPQIPHRVEKYLPIVAAENQCLDCHDAPEHIGKPKNMDRSKKNKSPMSKTHYAGNDPEGDVAGARFTCTQCHVPLSNASPLVDSTFR